MNSQPLTTYAVIAVSVIVTLLRMSVPGHGVSYAGSYEAFAHLYVGGLIGAWCVNRRRWIMATVVAMSAVELVAFLLR